MTLHARSSALERSYVDAELTTAEWAKSFHFASRFLPEAKRRAVFALYDYCRHADNLVDLRGERPIDDVRAELDALGDEVRWMHATGAASTTRWLALADTLRRYEVPLTPLLELLEGVAVDLEPVSMPDFPALLEYSRLVAGGVGLMLGPVLGAREAGFEASGVGLGIAMQLTNVLRDVEEDLSNGRCYLPADELGAFGITPEDLEWRRMTPQFRALMKFHVARARRYFDAADAVVGLFPPDGSRLTVRLLQRTYAGILDRIEALDYRVFETRAYVSRPHKLMILGRAWCAELARPASHRGARQSA